MLKGEDVRNERLEGEWRVDGVVRVGKGFEGRGRDYSGSSG